MRVLLTFVFIGAATAKWGGRDKGGKCSLPKETGPCMAYFERYHFDGESCQKFVYGGCRGNANNFGTQAECERACAPKNDDQNKPKPWGDKVDGKWGKWEVLFPGKPGKGEGAGSGAMADGKPDFSRPDKGDKIDGKWGKFPFGKFGKGEGAGSGAMADGKPDFTWPDGAKAWKQSMEQRAQDGADKIKDLEELLRAASQQDGELPQVPWWPEAKLEMEEFIEGAREWLSEYGVDGAAGSGEFDGEGGATGSGESDGERWTEVAEFLSTVKEALSDRKNGGAPGSGGFDGKKQWWAEKKAESERYLNKMKEELSDRYGAAKANWKNQMGEATAEWKNQMGDAKAEWKNKMGAWKAEKGKYWGKQKGEADAAGSGDMADGEGGPIGSGEVNDDEMLFWQRGREYIKKTLSDNRHDGPGVKEGVFDYAKKAMESFKKGMFPERGQRFPGQKGRQSSDDEEVSSENEEAEAEADADGDRDPRTQEAADREQRQQRLSERLAKSQQEAEASQDEAAEASQEGEDAPEDATSKRKEKKKAAKAKRAAKAAKKARQD